MDEFERVEKQRNIIVLVRCVTGTVRYQYIVKVSHSSEIIIHGKYLKKIFTPEREREK